MIRTLIVDDSPLIREGIRLLLESEKDIEVVGEAADGALAVSAVSRLRPDLIFLDVQMPGTDGFEVLEKAVSPTCAVSKWMPRLCRFRMRRSTGSPAASG